MVIPSAPGLSFQGHRCQNKFAARTEYVNSLSWKRITDPAVMNDMIYRNGTLIATVPASGPFEFIDHDRPKHQRDIYTLVAVNGSGVASSSQTLTLP